MTGKHPCNKLLSFYHSYTFFISSTETQDKFISYCISCYYLIWLQTVAKFMKMGNIPTMKTSGILRSCHVDTDSSSESFFFSIFKKYETKISYFYVSSLIKHQAIATNKKTH